MHQTPCHSNSECGIPATAGEIVDRSSAPRILIVGASTRAAAWSAYRAGIHPVCADCFADRDLSQVAEIVPVRSYPDSLPDDLSHVATEGWMFVGAMENHGRVLQALQSSAQFGRYCGPPGEALAKLRDPAWLADRLRPLNCYPRVILPEERTSLGSVRWLQKPLASGGGRGIRMLLSGDLQSPADEPCYWQEWIDGVSVSALFLCSEVGCRLMWVSQQLIGWEAAAAPTPFTYCGSIGPWPVSNCQTDELSSIAETVTGGLSYRGLLGMDLIWNGRQFRVIEINPRYTASCELWELSTGQSAVGEHAAAFEFLRRSDTTLLRSVAKESRVLGKLVVYAHRDLLAPDLERFLAPRRRWSIPWIADIPQAGAPIPRGAPICTVFARAPTMDACRIKLQRRAERVRKIVGTFPSCREIDGI